MLFDVILLLGIGLLAEAMVFSGQQGRAILCEDSIQYLASADSLLHGGHSAGFGIRKPGYPLLLAGIQLLYGEPGWAAVVANYLLLSLAPLVAYGVGRFLLSRGVGWLAAILTIVQMQSIPWGNRVLSEPLYMVLAGFGLLAFLASYRDERKRALLVGSGVLLGLAWLTRGVAVPIIGLAILALVVVSWHRKRLIPIRVGLFVAPLACLFLVECGLNYVTTEQFRASSGGSGIALWGCRMRYYQGETQADSPAIREVESWVPERASDDAYRANISDCWVGRFHAIRAHGLDDWQVNQKMQQAGKDAMLASPITYARCTLGSFYRHLFRRGGGNESGIVPADLRSGHITHPCRADSDLHENAQYLLWSDPFASDPENIQRTAAAVQASQEKAPFGTSPLLSALRYWKTKEPASSFITVLKTMGKVWPGFGLLFCIWLGWKRRECILLALMILCDAGLVSMVTITSDRFQVVWLPLDMALVAIVPVGFYVAFSSLVDRRRLNQHSTLDLT